MNTFFTLNKKAKAKPKIEKHILAVSHRSNDWKWKKLFAYASHTQSIRG
jgi:hypothetical protein